MQRERDRRWPRAAGMLERMSRTIIRGGTVFDGTGAPAAVADIAVEGDRIVAIGSGLDGDEAEEAVGLGVLPGLFDCHTHVMVSHVDLWRIAQAPFSYQFYEAVRNLRATLGIGITTIRDAGGADLGVKRAVEDGLIAGPRMQISVAMISQTGGHGDDWLPSAQVVSLMPPPPGSFFRCIRGYCCQGSERNGRS